MSAEGKEFIDALLRGVQESTADLVGEITRRLDDKLEAVGAALDEVDSRLTEVRHTVSTIAAFGQELRAKAAAGGGLAEIAAERRPT